MSTPSVQLSSTQVKWLQYGAGVFLLALILVICACLYRYLDDSPQATQKKSAKFEGPLSKVDPQKTLYDKVHQAMEDAQQQTKHLEQRLEKIEQHQVGSADDKAVHDDVLHERLQALENQLALLAMQKEEHSAKSDEAQFLNAIQPQGVLQKSPSPQIASTHLHLAKIQTKLLAKPAKNPDTYVPAGSFVKAVMLGGADVSASATSQTDPTPMLFRLVEEGTLPNQAKSHLKDCVVTAASRGDISSERGLIRLETLSCTKPNDEIIDIAVEGTIFGPEGKNGVRGIPLWRDGQLLRKAFVAGSLSGFANGVSQQFTTTSISPLGATETVSPGAVFKYGAANGASNAMDKLANYQIQRAEQYHPVIQLSAGTVVDVVFLKGFFLEGNPLLASQDKEAPAGLTHEEPLPMEPNVFDVSGDKKDDVLAQMNGGTL